MGAGNAEGHAEGRGGGEVEYGQGHAGAGGEGLTLLGFCICFIFLFFYQFRILSIRAIGSKGTAGLPLSARSPNTPAVRRPPSQRLGPPHFQQPA